jgi:DNA polymerase III psi subunit
MNSLQDYCLAVMGIVQWQRQDAVSNISTCEFMLIVDEALNDEKNQLIERMLLALKWSKNFCQITAFQSEDFAKKLNEIQPKKVLVFGENIIKSLGLSTAQNPFTLQSAEIAILPSLNELLVNVGLKKQAWQVMQKLM